ncbi:MAG: hypothetical protein ACTHKL_09520 [Streptosporangiaceae bacterium]
MTAGSAGGPSLPPDELRQIVREVLADVIGKPAEHPAASAEPPAGPPSSVPHADSGQSRPSPARGGGRDDAAGWTVRVSTDEDLHALVLRILKIADNPKLRRDLISGRARFRLSGTPAVAPVVTHQVEKGAVTERVVAAAAAAGARLVLGPRAVLTPLARDKARALGVPIERASTEKGQ